MPDLVVIFVVVLVILALAVAVKFYFKSRAAAVMGGGTFRLKVSEPEYSEMIAGKKTVEARLDRPPFNKLKEGDPLVVVRSRPQGDTSERPDYKFDAEVARVKKYENFAALFKAEGAKVYPGKSSAEASQRFSAYLPTGATASDPVIAIEVRKEKKAAKKKAAVSERVGRGESFVDDFNDNDDFGDEGFVY